MLRMLNIRRMLNLKPENSAFAGVFFMKKFKKNIESKYSKKRVYKVVEKCVLCCVTARSVNRELSND